MKSDAPKDALLIITDEIKAWAKAEKGRKVKQCGLEVEEALSGDLIRYTVTLRTRKADHSATDTVRMADRMGDKLGHDARVMRACYESAKQRAELAEGAK